MEEADTRDILGENVTKLGLAQIQRHLFLCCDQTKPKCCDKQELLVYPEGVWYGRVNKEAIERIIQEHLIGNQIVTEYAFLRHDLPAISRNCPEEEPETIEENSVKTS